MRTCLVLQSELHPPQQRMQGREGKQGRMGGGGGAKGGGGARGWVAEPASAFPVGHPKQ